MSTVWNTQLHLSFRLLNKPAMNLRILLGSHGRVNVDVQKELAERTYEENRSLKPGPKEQDARRYRDARFLYSTVGLLYEADDGCIVVTELGRAVARWLDILTAENFLVIGRYIVGALAVCQLRIPTRRKEEYTADVEVFPYAFIWRAMLRLDDCINSNELNRAILKVGNKDELETAIHNIAESRRRNDLDLMGPEVVTENDHIIPWMARASFGWTFINEKERTGPMKGYYTIRPKAREMLERASTKNYPSREFYSMNNYVEHVSRCALLPPDLRSV